VKRFLIIFSFIVCKAVSAQQVDDCFQASAQKYNLDPRLLWSIAMVESRGRTEAVNNTHIQRTGTRDFGVMQINESWLPALARHGITRDRLMKDRCLNVDVGAWILADSIKRNGATWNAVGAYNAACTQLKGKDCESARKRYTDLVWQWYSGSRPSKTPAVKYAQPTHQQAQLQPIQIIHLITIQEE
jgi:soluble lytic murein transglycosylase-like protein